MVVAPWSCFHYRLSHIHEIRFQQEYDQMVEDRERTISNLKKKPSKLYFFNAIAISLLYSDLNGIRWVRRNLGRRRRLPGWQLEVNETRSCCRLPKLPQCYGIEGAFHRPKGCAQYPCWAAQRRSKSLSARLLYTCFSFLENGYFTKACFSFLENSFVRESYFSFLENSLVSEVFFFFSFLEQL